MRLAIVLLSAVLFVGVAAIYYGCSREADIDTPEVVAESARLVGAPRRTLMNDKEKEELKCIYKGMVAAYTNCQTTALLAHVACVSNQLDGLIGNTHREFDGELIDLFHKRFLHREEPILFKSSADFESYALANIHLAKFIGRTYVQRRQFGGGLMSLECFTFRRLKMYCDRFRELHLVELQLSAEKMLSIWVAHIESEDGFTRRQIIYEYDYQRLGMKLGKIDSHHPPQYNVGVAQGLIASGYTPKWLAGFKK